MEELAAVVEEAAAVELILGSASVARGLVVVDQPEMELSARGQPLVVQQHRMQRLGIKLSVESRKSH